MSTVGKIQIVPVITIQTEVVAPRERVFDLARCIDLHQETMAATNEKAIAGLTKGLIGPDETVTWEATHFGVRQRLTSKITAFEPPCHFRDEMVAGAFNRFKHDHFFEFSEGKTTMRDIFDYAAPLGILGRFADACFLERYMKNLLTNRNELIKRIAESDDWKRFLT
jgi:ligand-binding SRPBCC domain-containing protein